MAFAALVDTGAIVSLFGRDQPGRAHYRALFEQAAAQEWQLSTTWPCVTEAAFLLDTPARYSMLRWIAAGAIVVFPFPQEVLEEMVPVMLRDTDRPRSEMDFADATLVWLAHDTGVLRVMTTDVRDFSRYRLPDGRAFEIL